LVGYDAAGTFLHWLAVVKPMHIVS
jgi:hypothetical protein